MTLTETQQSTIESWLSEHWTGQAKCPAGHDAWSLSPTMSFMPGFVTSELSPTMSFMPGFVTSETGPKIAHERGFTFVVMICTECAHVALLDTKTIGVSFAA